MNRLLQNNCIIVKVVEDDTGTFPNAFKSTYKCLPCRIGISGNTNYGTVLDDGSRDSVTYNSTCREGLTVSLTVGNEDRAIMCCNFRNNKIVKDSYYLAYLINGFYVLDNQAAFLENL